ncbi:hypothetical protein MJN54_34675, partial [Salmonella enterica subsp. enterica serovar Kentucky]|nr:hypothetical protein [Salmonella enterica subsp. enterica serovar Kentucky]
ALMSMLSWWKDLSIPLSNEDIHLEVYAPYIRDHLSKNNIVLLATWPESQTVRGTLADISDKVRDAGIRKTALILVGNFLGKEYH